MQIVESPPGSGNYIMTGYDKEMKIVECPKGSGNWIMK